LRHMEYCILYFDQLSYIHSSFVFWISICHFGTPDFLLPSSPKLFEDLLKDGIYCCGMVRSNMKGLPEKLRNTKQFKKSRWYENNARGYYDLCSFVSCFRARTPNFVGFAGKYCLKLSLPL
jgi:hypothetical protein